MLRLFALLLMWPQILTPTETYRPVPPPNRDTRVDIYHGFEVQDPYRWMENHEDPRLAPWIETQERLLNRYLDADPGRHERRRRVAELGRGSRYSLPIAANGRVFFMETAPSGTSGLSLLVRESGDSVDRVLFATADRFGPDASLAQISPSPDGRYVAFTLRRRQSRWVGLQIFDTLTGADLPEILVGPHSISGGISWTRDSEAFYYDAFEPPTPGSESLASVRGAVIRRHILRQPQAGDVIVASLPGDPNGVFSHRITDDGRFLVVTTLIDGARNRVMYQALSDPSAGPVQLIDQADAAYVFLGSRDRRFFFYTDKDASRGRVIAIDLDNPETAAWREIVPELDQAINARDLTGGNALGMYGGRLVLMYVRDGAPLLRIYSTEGRLERSIPLLIGGSVWGGFTGSGQGEEVFYRYLGLTDPSTLVRLNLRTGVSKIFRRAQVAFDSSSITVRRVFYRTPTGARAPMFLAHKKGLKANGGAPAYLYGYGAMGWVSFTWFQPHVLAWIEGGGVYAQPALPGEGGFGAEWRNAGLKEGKASVLAHYLAAADWLVANGFSKRGRIVAAGGSLSAPLAAMAAERRPELFGAATIAIPVLDLLRFDQFTGGSFWTPEFGSPQNASEWPSLRALSPYHNLKPGRCAPPTLVLVGELDQTAPPLHGYKYVAAAQAAQSCDNPVLLKIMNGAAHNYGRTPEKVAESYGDELAFLNRALGLTRVKPARE